jgi:hypothetical protein
MVGCVRGIKGAGHRHRRSRHRNRRFFALPTRRPVSHQINLDQEKVEDDCCQATQRVHIEITKRRPRPRSARGAL